VCENALNPTEKKPLLVLGTENTRYSIKYHYPDIRADMRFSVLFNLTDLGVPSHFNGYQTGPVFC
jgi:hypothetical protein